MVIETFINQPVPSNTYFISEGGHCIIIDPGSKEPNKYINYISVNNLHLDYILLTHDHFDHTWSADLLRKQYKAPIVCGEKCSEKLFVPQNYFNRLYYNDDTLFSITNIEIIVDHLDTIEWQGHQIVFYKTPGHSSSSICIHMDNNILFSGDTIIKGAKPFIKKRHEGSICELKESLLFIYSHCETDTLVYSGHGAPFCINEVKDYYSSYFGAAFSYKKGDSQ